MSFMKAVWSKLDLCNTIYHFTNLRIFMILAVCLVIELVTDEIKQDVSYQQVACPRACRLEDLSSEERKMLKGDPGPPGNCECNYEKVGNRVTAQKGEPGETKYIVKLIGKDLPPIRSEVFKEALKQVIAMGLKGEKGDPGNQFDPKSNVMKILRFSSLEKYRRHMIAMDHEPSMAELILIQDDRNTTLKNIQGSKLYFRFGSILHKIEMRPDEFNLDLYSQFSWFDNDVRQNSDVTYGTNHPRDSGRFERDNTSPPMKSNYNQSNFVELRALSLLQSNQENLAVRVMHKPIKYTMLLTIITLIIVQLFDT
ncbi:hypothetical protein GJ496_005725 [Pomphorhynchus laevis]|nr:hypothetical protein GJ496_005725 [Pomphorhynchus laevis]